MSEWQSKTPNQNSDNNNNKKIPKKKENEDRLREV